MESEWFNPLRRKRESNRFTEETVFDVLRNKRRRYALHHLKQVEEPVPVGDLAEQIAAWEEDVDVVDVAPQERKRVYISLLQNHLSTMEEAEIIEVDEERNEVTLTDAAADIDIYVDLVPERDIRWPEYYLGLSAFAGLFVLAARYEVGPLDQLPPVAWLGFVVCLFAVSAIVHYGYQRHTRLGNDGAPPE